MHINSVIVIVEAIVVAAITITTLSLSLFVSVYVAVGSLIIINHSRPLFLLSLYFSF